MQSADLREELKNRVVTIQQEIDRLKVERDAINKKLQDVESKLSVWRQAYEFEVGRLGEPSLPLFNKGGKSYRFVGMRLVDAVALIRQEQPEVDKRQALQILKKECFDFRGKRPLPAVHFAWVAIDRRKK